MENEMTLNEMELALVKCGTNYPEILDVVVMLQQNDLRNSETITRTVNSMDKTVDAVIELGKTVQEMSKMIIEMKKEIKELEEEIDGLEDEIDELEEEIEKMKGDNVEEKSTIEMCNDVVEAVENGNDDDFLASYMELTAALKAEVQQDIENEKEW
jgi:septal ring factor EnvC (AmiA/AmiB activator)